MWMSEKQWKNVFPFQSGYFGVTGRTGFVCDYKPCVWISVLTGAAVCPCQRDHRGHGGGHPEDVPQCQWPQTWGEQQSVFVFTVCTLTRCSVSLTGFQYITLQLTYRLLSTRICHWHIFISRCLLKIPSHSRLSLIIPRFSTRSLSLSFS